MTALSNPIKAESSSSARKRSNTEVITELTSLLSRESAKTKLRRLATRAGDVTPFNPVCPSTTLPVCRTKRTDCDKAHFEPIIRPYTDTSLGYCSYLNLCYGEPLFRSNPSLGDSTAPRGGTKECRYTHFQVAPTANSGGSERQTPTLPNCVMERLLPTPEGGVGPTKAQWVNCDLRSFDYSVLGQFQAIVADPPWDIHMSLPYGTMTDDELRQLPLPSLQPNWGILCLWVTGRAMELGRELLALWGYRRVNELVWVKVNQVQRLIRTGRTGHWLNHTCEHLLVAVKLPSDFPRDAEIPWEEEGLKGLRKGVDTDVVVAEVRETSRKPDQVYGVIERLAPHGRKLELFGRKHNARPGWITLGNQLGDSQIAELDLHARLVERYPGQPFGLVA